ncbi:hypothetical protein J7J83_00455 [bacterium]|nr:hypothetical protein [bacterium]
MDTSEDESERAIDKLDKTEIIIEMLSKASQEFSKDSIILYLASTDAHKLEDLPEYKRIRLPLLALFLFNEQIENDFLSTGLVLEDLSKLIDLHEEEEDSDESIILFAKVRLLIGLFARGEDGFEETLNAMKREFREGIIAEYVFNTTKLPPVLLISLDGKDRSYYKLTKDSFDNLDVSSDFIRRTVSDWARKAVDLRFKDSHPLFKKRAFERMDIKSQLDMDSLSTSTSRTKFRGGIDKWHILPDDILDKLLDVDLLKKLFKF